MARPVDFVGHVQPYIADDRDVSRYSDHLTVWIDKHIGEDNANKDLKKKFDSNIQVLQSNTPAEQALDDDSMLFADQTILQQLSDEVYCLKYFSSPERGVAFIHNQPNKKIFFISSGTIGKIVVPQIAELAQVQGIYIFCGNISYHTGWAGDYADKISAMLEHHDDLLERLTLDVARYVEAKGDEHQRANELLKARNCYAWTKKLLTRAQGLGSTSAARMIAKVDEKIEAAQSTSVTMSTD